MLPCVSRQVEGLLVTLDAERRAPRGRVVQAFPFRPEETLDGLNENDLRQIRDQGADAWAREAARELLELRAQISLEKERADRAERSAASIASRLSGVEALRAHEEARKGPIACAAHEYLKAMLIGRIQNQFYCGQIPDQEESERLAEAAKFFGEIMSRPSEKKS